MVTTIKLRIPDDLANKVHRITTNTEALIIDLLRSKVREMEQPMSMADEYKMAAAENGDLIKSFNHVDIEGWSDDY